MKKKKQYNRKSYKHKNQPDDAITSKDTFFFQVTACGIITLGIFLLVLLSPNSESIRYTIGNILHNQDFFYVGGLFSNNTEASNEIYQFHQENLEHQEHIVEDFRIDESLLDDIAFRKQDSLGYVE